MKYQVFPMKKVSYAVKIQFLSFICEDIKVAMTSSVTGNSKYYQSIACVYLFILKSGTLKKQDGNFKPTIPNFDINLFRRRAKGKQKKSFSWCFIVVYIVNLILHSSLWIRTLMLSCRRHAIPSIYCTCELGCGGIRCAHIAYM